jgi:hypothetical protein
MLLLVFVVTGMASLAFTYRYRVESQKLRSLPNVSYDSGCTRSDMLHIAQVINSQIADAASWNENDDPSIWDIILENELPRHEFKIATKIGGYKVAIFKSHRNGISFPTSWNIELTKDFQIISEERILPDAHGK